MTIKVTVNPNPFNAELLLLIHAGFTINVVIRLLAESGSVVRIASGTLRTGDNEIKMDKLHRYAAGHYRLEIKLLNGDLLQTIPLVKHTVLSAL